MARRISSTSASAAMATLTRWSARADAARRSRSTFRARSAADSCSIRRKAIVVKPQASSGDHRDHHDRCPAGTGSSASSSPSLTSSMIATATTGTTTLSQRIRRMPEA